MTRARQGIGEVLVSARSYAEHVEMFDLTDADLGGRVLDCPGGAAGFTATALDRGRDVTAVNPAHAGGPAALAALADASFDLALCSHLLFTYADRLDAAWHLAALVELARVAAQVRVFPLVSHVDGRPYARLDALRGDLAARDTTSEVRRVPYELQRGGDQVLVLTGGAS